jgi:hypothetical protein
VGVGGCSKELEITKLQWLENVREIRAGRAVRWQQVNREDPVKKCVVTGGRGRPTARRGRIRTDEREGGEGNRKNEEAEQKRERNML